MFSHVLFKPTSKILDHQILAFAVAYKICDHYRTFYFKIFNLLKINLENTI